jgi:MFS family permease
MFWGMMLSTLGSSMIWPFLMIYVSEKLDLPLAAVATLLTINSIAALISSFLAGPLVDRYGRKWMMVVSLLLNGIAYIFLSQAESLTTFAILMTITGLVNPLYRIGADAMLADLIPEKERVEAYALLRLSNNVGIAIGPAIGGFIASASYAYAFYMAAFGMTAYSLLLAFFAVETLPKFGLTGEEVEKVKEKFGGYLDILKDKKFVLFATAFTMVVVCAAFMWTLMPVYAKQNFGVPENKYGFIPTTNAIMVVTLQLAITNWSKKLQPLMAMAIGGTFYTIAVGSVALGTGFWGFWASMVVMTIGELILVPTSSTYVANMAPADKRGRYMSIYGLSWSISTGVGSLIGGALNDVLGPQAIWYGGAIIGFFGVLTFLVMKNKDRQTTHQLALS